MQRIFGLLSLLLIAAVAPALQAQQSAKNSAAPRSQTATFLAPFVPLVAGAPVTATYDIEVERPLAGGGTETLHSVTHVARDAQGRVRHELHGYVPASQMGEPPLLYVILSDPVARLSHVLDPQQRTDTRMWFHASHANLSAPGATTEDLGSKTTEGFAATGERRTWHDRSEATGQPLHRVDEIWFSNELQLRVSEQRKSFSGLVMKITLAHVQRGEPDAVLFEVPHGYRVPSIQTHISGRWWAPETWTIASPDTDEGGVEGCCSAPGYSR